MEISSTLNFSKKYQSKSELKNLIHIKQYECARDPHPSNKTKDTKFMMEEITFIEMSHVKQQKDESKQTSKCVHFRRVML